MSSPIATSPRVSTTSSAPWMAELIEACADVGTELAVCTLGQRTDARDQSVGTQYHHGYARHLCQLARLACASLAARPVPTPRPACLRTKSRLLDQHHNSKRSPTTAQPMRASPDRSGKNRVAC